MLLLDKNAEPKKTIFYLSAIVHGLILCHHASFSNIHHHYLLSDFLLHL
ncbi:Uncharacterised protein [Streptococcus pneumoniae]|nr:Uncharacterised protein [Streptococcus pneumoniae]